MKNLLLLLLLTSLFQVGNLTAQEKSLEDWKNEKTNIENEIADAEAKLSDLNATRQEIQDKIELLSGWMFGFGGTVGFGFNANNNWQGSPNPTSNSSTLSLNGSAFANNIKEKTLWRNTLLVAKQWQDIDVGEEDDKLFDNGTVDLLNLSSLWGYRIHPQIALSALGELNTSLGNFLAPGTADIGVGATWTPFNNLVVVVHPLNYHYVWSRFDNVESSGALGAKFRADYNQGFTIASTDMTFTSNLTGFLPYGDKTIDYLTFDDDGNLENTEQVSLAEWTWINNLSFNIWKGIGVGLGLGLRNANAESPDLQTFYTAGLNYAF